MNAVNAVLVLLYRQTKAQLSKKSLITQAHYNNGKTLKNLTVHAIGTIALAFYHHSAALKSNNITTLFIEYLSTYNKASHLFTSI
ncbi:hypothetical protein ACGP04_13030 [Piscirickettsia salmonis]|uniref:hypothetical protein n=1 Tax=Piscirickettsia salmonis TaxID=1238 RepID=UPI000F085CE1|nr:hypothetical protein DA717_08550 [Piscirickettsiaceae bacterium NZ-RLO2]